MKFAIAATLIAAVAAAPTTNTHPTGGQCSINGDNDGKVACCNSAIPILGQILCGVSVGAGCQASQTAYCCSGNSVVCSQYFYSPMLLNILTNSPGRTHQRQPPQLPQHLNTYTYIARLRITNFSSSCTHLNTTAFFHLTFCSCLLIFASDLDLL